MQKLLMFGIVIMLFFGCSGSNKDTGEKQVETSNKQNTGNTGNLTITTKPDDNLVKTCFPLKLPSGEYIFTAADAAQVFGGKWKVKYELFLDGDPQYVDHCAYVLEDQNGKQLIAQTTVPSDTFEPEGKKTMPELGTAYVEGGSLIMKKGKDVIDIECTKLKSIDCSDEDTLRIGKIIMARWPH